MKNLVLILLAMILLTGCNPRDGKTSAVKVNPDSIVYENIFPYQNQHCHASTITELPNKDLLVAWFQGSGERAAEDVVIKGSRFNHLTGSWSEPFILADDPGFPDINPVLFVDNRSRLWLVWYTVLAYQWESSLMKYRISEDYSDPSKPPVWSWQDVLLVKADGSAPEGIGKNDAFVKKLEAKYEEYHKSLVDAGYLKKDGSGVVTEEMWKKGVSRYMDIALGSSFIRDGAEINEKGEKVRKPLGYPVMRRIGWQTRNKPLQIGNKILLPLYSDGFDFSLIAISNDCGDSWSFSEPIVGAACIQPAMALREDSTIVAYMRDNGPPPQRLMTSTSSDFGKTWTVVKDSDIPNPGSAADLVKLKSGNWVLVGNDLDEGRHRLTVMLSTDEGKSWPYRKHVINGLPGSQTRAHYPAIIQDSEGLIHLTFTNQVPSEDGKSNVKNIAHAIMTEGWLKK
ncbi:MAG: exo-alpha-sialidase [Bacteroidales bacterium]